MSASGLSTARLRRLRGVLSRQVESGAMPGLVALVARRGEVHVEAIGTTETGGSEPMRRDTIFRIASVTKQIAAATAMTLVEECRLRLDDPVDDLLPELADRQVLARLDAPLDDTVPAHRPITLRDLLTFVMGLGAFMAPPGQYPIQRAMEEAELQPGPGSAPVSGSGRYAAASRGRLVSGTWNPVSAMSSGRSTRSASTSASGCPVARAISTPSTSEPVW